MDSSQLSNANATRAALEGCIDVVGAYRNEKHRADSIIQKQKTLLVNKGEELITLGNITIENEQNIKFLEKSLKKENRKKVGNQILFYTFAVSSAALMVLYLTK